MDDGAKYYVCDRPARLLRSRVIWLQATVSHRAEIQVKVNEVVRRASKEFSPD